MAQRRKHDWKALFTEQKKSGMTILDFCKSKNIHQNLWYKNSKNSHNSFVELPDNIRDAAREEIQLITKDFDIKIKSGCNSSKLMQLFSALGINHDL